MKHIYVFVLLSLCLFSSFLPLKAQIVPPLQPEQDCIGALPVCSPILPIPFTYQGEGLNPNEIDGTLSCLGGGEVNDVWFEILIANDGVLDFVITPVDPFDDYDWAIYDMTSASCTDIATNASLEVSCNFSGLSGNTGPTSTSPVGGPFNAPFPVYAGESYVINVSNWSGSGSGFTLDFSLSTGLSYDTTNIAIHTITNLSTLDGLLVLMNEPILCSQVDSGDFVVTDPNGLIIPILSATPLSCDSSFADSIALYLDPQITPAQLLTFSVALTADVVYLCSQDSVNTTPLPIANLNTGIMVQGMGSNNNICQGDSVLLTTPFTGLSGFQSVWMPGNIQADQVVIVADSSINYTVSTLSIATGLSGNDNIKLDIDAYPDWVPLEDIVSCDKSVLVGSTDSSLTYLWSNNSNSPNFVIDSNQAGTYTVVVSQAIGCSIMDTLTVSFATFPVLQPSFSVGSSPLDINFISNASNVDSVSWDFGDGNIASGPNPSHSYTQSGNYQVVVTGYSVCGDKQDTLNVAAFASSVGANLRPLVKLWVAQESLHLSFETFEGPHYQLLLTDLNGRRVIAAQNIRSQNTQISLAGVAQGMYLVRLLDAKGQPVHLSKVVKL
ncbi:MAG: PKD domain-containing protein [Bacteroidota bacterium]